MELQLLSHIAENGALNEALAWGLEETDFVTDEGRHIFQTMLYTLRDPRYKKGQLGLHSIKRMHPDFVFCNDKTMTLEALCTQVREQRHRMKVQAISKEMLNAKGDPVDVAAQAALSLQRNILAVAYGKHSDISFSDSLMRSASMHDQQASGVDLSIAKWPWAPFNTAAGGIEKDDYIVFYGRPKSKKSWMLAFFAAFLYMQGKFPLIYTKEMTADNLFKRIGACIGELPYQEFRKGRLSPEERERLQAILDAARDLQGHLDMIMLDGKDSNGGDTVEWLQAKVDKYKPDIVLIDGMHLMSDGRGSKGQKDNFRVQNISRGIRQMILDMGTPVIATTQATRSAAGHKNANLDEIAFSDAVSQDVTAAIRVISEGRTEISPDRDMISLIVGGSREWTFAGCRIYGECATDFSFHSYLDQKEIDSVKQRDDSADVKDPTGGAAPTAKKKKLGKAATEVKDIRAKINRTVKRTTAERVANLGAMKPPGAVVRTPVRKHGR